MLDFSSCTIDDLIVHQVGNKTQDEELMLSTDTLDKVDVRLEELLIK